MVKNEAFDLLSEIAELILCDDLVGGEGKDVQGGMVGEGAKAQAVLLVPYGGKMLAVSVGDGTGLKGVRVGVGQMDGWKTMAGVEKGKVKSSRQKARGTSP